MRRRIVGLVIALALVSTGFAVGIAAADTPQGAGSCWVDQTSRATVSQFVGMDQTKGEVRLIGTCYGKNGKLRVFEMTVPAGPWLDYLWQQAEFFHAALTP